jgi:hypothetical protein
MSAKKKPAATKKAPKIWRPKRSRRWSAGPHRATERGVLLGAMAWWRVEERALKALLPLPLTLARPTPQAPRPKRAHDRRVRVAIALCHRQPHAHVCAWARRDPGLPACPAPRG